VAKGNVANADGLVIATVKQAVSFGGVRIAPTETHARRPQKVAPVRAVIPLAICDRHPDSRVEYVGPAPDGARVGVIK